MSTIETFLIWDPARRNADIRWGHNQIHHLYRLSIQFQDISSLLYCCFEARTFLENVEFGISSISIPTKFQDDLLLLVNSRYGVKGVVDKYNSFVDSFINLVKNIQTSQQYQLPKETFSAQHSVSLREKLNRFLHLYTCIQDDFDINSQFANDARSIIIEVLAYIEDTMMVHGDGFYSIGSQLINDERISEKFEQYKDGKFSEEDLINLFKTLN